MTQEQLIELIAAACSVAAAVPNKPGQYVFAAKVPWTRIDRLREALEDAGYPWRNWV